MDRTLIILAGAVVCLLGTSMSPNQARAEEKAAAKHAGFVHTVIIYLKKDAPAGSTDAVLADARELLTKVPTVRLLKVGPRSEQANGPRNDKEFQIGLLVLFDNYDGLQAYIVHPNHKEFVRRLEAKNITEKITVFDFQDEGK